MLRLASRGSVVNMPGGMELSAAADGWPGAQLGLSGVVRWLCFTRLRQIQRTFLTAARQAKGEDDGG